MKLPLLVCVMMGLAPVALAQDQAKPAAPRASETIAAKAKLTVTTPGWSNGGDIAFDYTQYRDNKFPGLKWSAGPSGTKSYRSSCKTWTAVARCHSCIGRCTAFPPA